jgi:hypothetical protein
MSVLSINSGESNPVGINKASLSVILEENGKSA